MFLDFANFYKKFIRNFSRIVALLTLMLWIIDKSTKNDSHGIWTNKNKKNQNALGAIGRAGGGSLVEMSKIWHLL